MKKLYSLLIILIILLIVNFSLWFLHTRAITAAINTVKEKAADVDIEIKYDDLNFPTFMSWNAKAVLKDVWVNMDVQESKLGKVNKAAVFIPKIEIVSNPIFSEVEARIIGDMDVFRDSRNGKEKVYEVRYSQHPELYLKLRLSILDILGAAVGEFEDLDPKKAIKVMQYSDKGFVFYDVVNGRNYMTYDNNEFYSNHDIRSKEEVIDYKAKLEGLLAENTTMSSNYANFGDGENNLKANFSFIKRFAEDKEDRDTADASDVEEYRFKVRELRLSSDSMGFSAEGYLNNSVKEQNLEMKLGLDFRNYEVFVDIYTDVFNMLLARQAKSNPLVPRMIIDDEQKESVKRRIKKVFNVENDLSLLILNKKGSRTTINGMPLDMIVAKFLAAEKEEKKGKEKEKKGKKKRFHKMMAPVLNE